MARRSRDNDEITILRHIFTGFFSLHIYQCLAMPRARLKYDDPCNALSHFSFERSLSKHRANLRRLARHDHLRELYFYRDKLIVLLNDLSLIQSIKSLLVPILNEVLRSGFYLIRPWFEFVSYRSNVEPSKFKFKFTFEWKEFLQIARSNQF